MDTGKYDTIDPETIDEETGEIEGELRPAESEVVKDDPAEAPRTYQQARRPALPAPGTERAADGAIMQTTAHTAGHFVDMLEDGDYSREVTMQLRKLADKMAAITDATGGKTRGKVTLELDLLKEGEHFTIQAKVKTKEPELPRPKSIVWTDHNGSFTRFPPGQAQMFGTRQPRNI